MVHGKHWVVACLLAPCLAHADIDCDQVSNLAEATMEARQNGALIKDLMAKVHDMPNPDYRELARQLTLLAYERDLYQSKRAKQSAISEFANTAWLKCNGVREASKK